MNETKIDKVDYITAFLYLSIGGFILVAYNFSTLSQENINKLLLALTFAGPLSLFLMYYKRFRIGAVTLLWFGIAMLQLVFVYQLRENPDFKAVNGTYADNYLNLLVMMVMITLFRFLSLLLTKQEFMVAAWFSPKDNRRLNFLDYILSVAGFLVLTIGITLI